MSKKHKNGTENAISNVITSVITNKHVRKFLCGTYSDGSTRSVSDAIRGEIISPTDRNRKLKVYQYMESENKKKKKKKKNKNKNNYHTSIEL